MNPVIKAFPALLLSSKITITINTITITINIVAIIANINANHYQTS